MSGCSKEEQGAAQTECKQAWDSAKLMLRKVAAALVYGIMDAMLSLILFLQKHSRFPTFLNSRSLARLNTFNYGRFRSAWWNHGPYWFSDVSGS
jgi:hypothetical protein